MVWDWLVFDGVICWVFEDWLVRRFIIRCLKGECLKWGLIMRSLVWEELKLVGLKWRGLKWGSLNEVCRKMANNLGSKVEVLNLKSPKFEGQSSKKIFKFNDKTFKFHSQWNYLQHLKTFNKEPTKLETSSKKHPTLHQISRTQRMTKLMWIYIKFYIYSVWILSRCKFTIFSTD